MQNLILSLLALAAIVPRAEAADASEGSNVSGETKRVRWAESPPVKQNTWRIQRMKDNPVIDADWNKPAWQSVAPLTLEYYMGKEPAHQPKTQARAAYDDQYIYVIWKVDDNYVLGKRTQHQQDVWRDSCVEFFFTPDGDSSNSGYFNLETNCCGFKLLNAHFPDRDEYIFKDDDFATIRTASSLKSPINPETKQSTVWTLEYRIPFSLLEKAAKVERPKPGVTWRGNFYKCADDSSHPHWLTWSPVHNAEPSFHLPAWFGKLEFE